MLHRKCSFEQLETKDLLTAYLLQDLNLATEYGFGRTLNDGHSTYFYSRRPDLGVEIWQSDGTVEGTKALGETEYGELFHLGAGQDERLVILESPQQNDHSWNVESIHGGTKTVLATFNGRLQWHTEFDNGLAFIVASDQDARLMWTDGVQMQTLAEGLDAVGRLFAINEQLLMESFEDGELWEFREGGLHPLKNIPEFEHALTVRHGDFLYQQARVGEATRLYVRQAPDFQPIELGDFGEDYFNFLRYPDFPPEEAVYFSTFSSNGTSVLWQTDGTTSGTLKLETLEGHRFTQVASDSGSTYVISERFGFDGFVGTSISKLVDGNLETIDTLAINAHIQDFTSSGIYLTGYSTFPSELIVIDDGSLRSTHPMLREDDQVIDITDDFFLVRSPGETPYKQTLNAIDLHSGERQSLATLDAHTRGLLSGQLAAVGDQVLFEATIQGKRKVLAFNGQDYSTLIEDPGYTQIHEVPGGAVIEVERYHAAGRERSVFISRHQSPTELQEVSRPDDFYFTMVTSFQGNFLFSNGGELWTLTQEGQAQEGQGPPVFERFFDLPNNIYNEDFVETDHGLFFLVRGGFGTEIWYSDGTQGGTSRQRSAEEHGGFLTDLANVGNDLYFVRQTSRRATSNQVVRWDAITDEEEVLGEFESRVELKETELGLLIVAISESSTTVMNINSETLFNVQYRVEPEVVAAGNQIFLSLDLKNGGKAIWRTDGSPSGTEEMFRDPTAEWISPLLAHDGLVYFQVSNPEGIRLWATDGTNDHTYVYESPGGRWGYHMVLAQGRVFAAGHHTNAGMELWAITGPSSIPADFDGNGQIGFEDFLVLSEQFMMRGDDLEGDLDADGDVDFTDFLQFSSSYGASKPSAPDTALATIEPRRVDLVFKDDIFVG